MPLDVQRAFRLLDRKTPHAFETLETVLLVGELSKLAVACFGHNREVEAGRQSIAAAIAAGSLTISAGAGVTFSAESIDSMGAQPSSDRVVHRRLR